MKEETKRKLSKIMIEKWASGRWYDRKKRSQQEKQRYYPNKYNPDVIVDIEL